MDANSENEVSNSQKYLIRNKNSHIKDDAVVISGISGTFPSSANVGEFIENLYNKVDMVSDVKHLWDFDHPQMPKRIGIVNDFDKFDAQFFRVPNGQAAYIDSMNRKSLENAYGALFDAGINPVTLAGTKVGVFMGASFLDTTTVNTYDLSKNSSYIITGISKAMLANRISYWLNSNAESYTIDSACCSSMAALEHAYRAIKQGQCDSALVGGSNHCICPALSVNLRCAGVLSLDGKTKCFDKNGDGYTRSEAIVLLYLQRASEAKRIYAEVVHVKGTYFPSLDLKNLYLRKSEDLETFLDQFYSEVEVSPKKVEYIEGFGAGNSIADSIELEAIGNIFAKHGNIKIGCVKSNMGHSEGASDACGLAKVCVAYQKGSIPANLHYDTPLDHISAIQDGKIEVVTDHSPFNRGYVGLNSFSYTGYNYHALLKGHFKEKNLNRYRSSIPYLVLASGRTDKSVSKIFDSLKNTSIDAEQIGLLNDFFSINISGHTSRGYIVLDTDNRKGTVSLAEKIDYFGGSNSVWFMYSGMGSQWPGMGTELLRIPTFAAAIESCRTVLKPKGIDILEIITNTDDSMFDNILHCFVGITAIQIGLTDILTEMGIIPDKIIGHSLGELGCAYADGSLTIEEVILSAYYRGLVSIETDFIDGLMAAVMLSHDKIATICPPDIDVACHNSSTSSTISGPAESIKKFVQEMNERHVFAKEVPTANIAYHSRYVQQAGPRLLESMKNIIKKPKRRSDKWICTSAPPEKWNEDVTKYASAEYFTNNLLNHVYFDEAAKKIPANALIVEIAPHGLMQAILKRSHRNCTNISLTKRGHNDPIKLLLGATGELYNAGLNPKIDFLYPKIEYPVSTETPLLSPLVKWAHIENWPVAVYSKKETSRTSGRQLSIFADDDDWVFLKGYMRNGAHVFPESALLILVWETWAMYNGMDYRNVSIIFSSIKFYKELHMNTEEILKFNVMIQKGSQRFEIFKDEILIATGFIQIAKGNTGLQTIRTDTEKSKNNDDNLTMENIYSLMHLRGYSYKGDFQSIQSSNMKFNEAIIKWSGNWVTFLDALIQLNTFARDHDGVSTPKYIRKLTIDTKRHIIETQWMKNNITGYNALFCKRSPNTRCGGVEINDIIFNDIPVVENNSAIVKIITFVPHFLKQQFDMQTVIKINLQIVIENTTLNKVKIVTSSANIKINEDIKNVVNNETFFGKEVVTFVTENVEYSLVQEKKNNVENVCVINNLLSHKKKLQNIFDALNEECFILAIEEIHTVFKPDEVKYFKVVTSMLVNNVRIVLLRKTKNFERIVYMNENYDNLCLSKLKNESESGNKVILVSENQQSCNMIGNIIFQFHYNDNTKDRAPTASLYGYVKALRNKNFYNINAFIIKDATAPHFDLNNSFYINQLEKNLTFNIFVEGNWGGYYWLLPTYKPNMIRNISLNSKNIGGIDTLAWTEAPITNDDNVIQVCYAGLSFLDCEKAIGEVKNENNNYGMDFSGYNTRGERVMGLISSGALNSRVEPDSSLLWPVPCFWSLQDAATVPLPYVHAYYCLFIRSSLKEHETVFVTGGAGALGQAVISICLANKCTVLTSVSNVEKKRYLLRIFPELREENVLSSQEYNFNGRECDCVISCASGEMRECLMKFVAPFGLFLDISILDSKENMDIGLSYLRSGKSYQAVNLSSIFQNKNVDERKQLHRLVSRGIAEGIVIPMSRLEFPTNDVTRAFRFLSSRKNIGRVLIKMNINASVENDDSKIKITPRITLSSTTTYIVICGENVFGLELASWLIKRGVKKIVIHTRNSSMARCFRFKQEAWNKSGILSALSTTDLQRLDGCVDLLTESENIGPVEGIFILRESRNQTPEKHVKKEFVDDASLKTGIILNLDKVSRNMCHNLSYFVIFNPSYGNIEESICTSVIENTIDLRKADNLPALILQTVTLDQMNTGQLFVVFNALDECLKYKFSNASICEQAKHSPNNFIKKIMGILYAHDFDENASFKELGVTEINLCEVRRLVYKEFNVDYTTKELSKFSLKRLKSLGDNKKANIPRDGLSAFYTYIHDDKIDSTEPIVIMPSQISKCYPKVEGEIDSKDTYLIMVPGFEGHHHIFEDIGERLKIQAAALQLSPDLIENDILKMAEALLKHLKFTFQFNEHFYLMGYSFGVNIALELAALLEKEGYTGVVYCLDSSPDALRVQLNTFLGHLSNTELQNKILAHMTELMTGSNNDKLNKDFSNITTWSDKVQACLDEMKKTVTYSHEYQKNIMEAAYRRIILAKEYDPDFKLSSDIVLIKGQPHPKAKNLDNDYGLSKYSNKPIKIFHIESDHISAPRDYNVPNIINRMLNPKLLEEYKKKNLCEIYINDVMKIEKIKREVNKS